MVFRPQLPEVGEVYAARTKRKASHRTEEASVHGIPDAPN